MSEVEVSKTVNPKEVHTIYIKIKVLEFGVF